MLNMNLILRVALAAVSVSVVTMAIAMSKLFEPVRAAVQDRTSWGGNLISCPYCLSHWVSFAAVLVFGLRLPFWNELASLLVLTATLIVASAPVSWLLFMSYSVMKIE